ncbi:unnamed protein product, partial [Effrenium voratum]
AAVALAAEHVTVQLNTRFGAIREAMEGKEVVPTWDGAPKGWRRNCKEVAWYVRGNKQSMRKYLATRLISKLTGTARLLAMSWSQAEFDTEDGVTNFKRYNNEKVADFLVRETLGFEEFQEALIRLKQERSGVVAEWKMHRTLRVGGGLEATVECLKKKMLLTRRRLKEDVENQLHRDRARWPWTRTGEMNGEMVGTLVGNIMSVGEMTILLYGNLLEANMEKTRMILDYKNCRSALTGNILACEKGRVLVENMGGKFTGKHMNYADTDWHWDLVMAKGKNKNKNANWTAYDMAYAFPHGKNKGKFKGSKGSQVNAYVADYYGLEMEVDGQTRGDLHAAEAQSAKDNEENRSLLVPVLVGMDFAGDTGTGMVVDLVDGTCVFSLIDPLRHYTLQQNSKGHYMVDLVEYLTGGVTVSQGHANIILLQEVMAVKSPDYLAVLMKQLECDKEGKKQMEVLEKDRAMELDGRDPRASDQQWPCYGTHEPMRHRSNKWGMWMHCSQCALRLIYLPKKGAPSDSTEVKNHQDVKQALKQLEEDFATMKGILPTEEMVRVAIEKHTTNQRYADVLAKCKNKPVAAKPMKKGYQTTASAPRSPTSAASSWGVVEEPETPTLEQEILKHITTEELIKLKEVMRERSLKAQEDAEMLTTDQLKKMSPAGN